MEQETVMGQEASQEDTSEDVMAARPLHRIMVFLDKPAAWSNVRSGVTILLLLSLVAGTWWLFGVSFEAALLVGGMMLLFFLGDILILVMLPRFRISFGAWQPQFFQLAILRTLAALILALAVLISGWQWALLLFVLLQLLGTVALHRGAVVEPGHVQTTYLEIQNDRLSPGAQPLRLLHISDLHIEYLSRREEDVLLAVETEKPDLILITGDYVNLSFNQEPQTYGRIHDFLAKLSAPFGVYATLGTPTVDIPDRVAPMFDDLAIDLLRNELKTITMSDGQRITLVGVDCTHYLRYDAAIMRQVMQQAPNDAPTILLYHSPELMPPAVEEGIDLYLCGHTHGGQVRLPLIGALLTSSQLGRRYVMGSYRQSRTHLYVSRGVGLEGLSAPRVRFLARPEITLVTIKPGPPHQKTNAEAASHSRRAAR